MGLDPGRGMSVMMMIVTNDDDDGVVDGALLQYSDQYDSFNIYSFAYRYPLSHRAGLFRFMHVSVVSPSGAFALLYSCCRGRRRCRPLLASHICRSVNE